MAGRTRSALSVKESRLTPFDLMGSDGRGRIDRDLRRVILDAEVGWLMLWPRAPVVRLVSNHPFAYIADSESTATETDADKAVETELHRQE